ncbi:MAG: adenylosuccinate lyase [Candidatus Diapherotrites archaeon]|nr:adenylosuccinate lyase [Candidatus Diapherotrites archaeon]
MNDPFDLVSPLDFRYIPASRQKAYAAILSENARVAFQARVEAALVHALAKQKVCSLAVAREVAQAAKGIRAREVYAEEKRIAHDVRALVNCLKRRVSKKSAAFIHFGATSYDIVDTANALRYQAAVREIVLPALLELETELLRLAKRHAGLSQIGRTHGQHAEPITFGFFLANYVERLGSRILLIQETALGLEGKFSGAVGAYNALTLSVPDPLRLERDIMNELGLQCSPVSSQVVPPESVEDLLHAMVSAFTVLANLADDFRNLQRTEIGEIAEAFGSRQVGSSTMPHKRNPLNFENVKSFYKQFMPRMVSVYLDGISEHQRDLTNSASQRFLPEMFVALSLSAERLTKVLRNLMVDEESMQAHLQESAHLIAAEPLYILLARHGHPDAHETARRLSMKARQDGCSVLEAAQAERSLYPFLKKFSSRETGLLKDPVKYTGLSRQKALQVCRRWTGELKKNGLL